MDLVAIPKGKSIVTSIWIYKIKYARDGNVDKCKSRFVSQGFSQKEGIDYDDTLSHVAIFTTIRAVISLTSIIGWKLHKMDVKTTFLNGDIEEHVYIEHPEGILIHGKESHVCKLNKYLYGINQAPQAWYTTRDNYFQIIRFSKVEADPNL